MKKIPALRVAVISDIHANAVALRSALSVARDRGFDYLVILGDLLTYGVDVTETLELLHDVVDERGAIMILGNHDQLYLDIERANDGYSKSLPDWVRDSVDHTWRLLKGSSSLERFSWQERFCVGPLYFAHANPFKYGDWTYLNDESSRQRALERVCELGYRVGVFGHNHRSGVFVREALGSVVPPAHAPRTTAQMLVNAGSLGQPRSADAVSTIAFLELEAESSAVSVEIQRVHYDVESHLRRLMASSLSLPTRQHLAAYFLPSVR